MSVLFANSPCELLFCLGLWIAFSNSPRELLFVDCFFSNTWNSPRELLFRLGLWIALYFLKFHLVKIHLVNCSSATDQRPLYLLGLALA